MAPFNGMGTLHTWDIACHVQKLRASHLTSVASSGGKESSQTCPVSLSVSKAVSLDTAAGNVPT